MAINVKAEASGEDRRMTLDELREFVEHCNRAEIPGDARLKVVTKGFSGHLRSIEVERR